MSQLIPNVARRLAALSAAILAGFAASSGAMGVGYSQGSAGASARNVQDKLRETVSIKDHGAVGDGVADDTAAILAALAAAKHVIVPAGMTCLISATIPVPVGARLDFLGGLGNTNNAYPASYFVKKSTMTTAGITVAERAWVSGGGLVCQAGNTGDGIQLIGNSAKVQNFLVHKAGGNGVRVGTDAGGNFNSFQLDHVTSQYNGQNGFVIHDGKTGVGADANAGTLIQCFAQFNGASGFLLKHCFWNTLINCLAEVNTAYGIYLSGANDGSGVPECRYITVLGGDYNEGNTAGQIFDQGYFTTWINPDPANCPTNGGSGLAGSGVRNVVTSQGASQMAGLTIKTQNSTAYAATMDDGTGSNMSYPVVIKKTTGGGNAQGAGLAFTLNDGTTTYANAGAVRVQQSTTGQWSMYLGGYKAGAALDVLRLDVNAMAISPAADNTFAIGTPTLRPSQICAVTSTINTSDAREKQGSRTLSAQEIAVGRRLKALITAYLWNEAVARKGEGARWHFGWIAQDVIAAFAAEGLDAFAYGCCCHDVWDAKPAELDEEGRVLSPAVAAGDRYGVRLDEIFALVFASL